MIFDLRRYTYIDREMDGVGAAAFISFHFIGIYMHIYTSYIYIYNICNKRKGVFVFFL